MPLCKLTRGFLEFREGTFLPQRAHFAQLAQRQQPRVMMIACSDSRVDPAILTNADPGDLFVVRNVANLVPPCLVDQAQHGVSAALQFGVTALGVEHIIVFGHVDCGGIHALLTSDPKIDQEHTFIHRWLQIAAEARGRTLLIARDRPLEDQLRILEQEAIKTSLANLLTFPWIEQRVAQDRLRLHGWTFDINGGEMRAYVPERDAFEPLTLELAARLQGGRGRSTVVVPDPAA
jgi:carbonic anhydrase